MKSLILFYLLIIVPFGIILILNLFGLINEMKFVGLLMFYLLIYRTFIDGNRLVNKKIIPKRDIWKMLRPGFRIDHFKDLYLK